MTAIIYLLRHGQTVWNRAGRHQGHEDSPLTLRGIHQATAMGRRLASLLDGRAPDLFLSSPLGRSYQTATLVADAIGHDPETIRREHRLREVTAGAWDGMMFSEIRERHADAWEARLADKWNFVPPRGESYRLAAERVGTLLDELPASGTLVIVAHGSLNRVIRGLLLGLEPDVMLALDEPQDGFYTIVDGSETYVAA
jgi:broad specificity phosphatase PhoE